jgi:hypothetical protein
MSSWTNSNRNVVNLFLKLQSSLLDRILSLSFYSDENARTEPKIKVHSDPVKINLCLTINN